MAENFRFELNRSGVCQLLKSPEILAVCREHAEATFAGCEADGYELETRNYPERAGCAVVAKKYPAIADNLKHNTLLKALK